jgi:5'-3' exonuclease
MILAIDGTNWIHSLWHAQHGRGVLAAVCARITALVDRLKPQHVVACFDRRSFRHDLFPAYKAGRKEKPADLVRDLEEGPAAVAELAAICAEDGFEADDCLAALAAAGQQLGQKVVLASPDKDLRQCLVDGQVTILRSFTLLRDQVETLEWFTTCKLRQDFKLVPSQWPAYQALCGDSTDGIPGCVGWGEVTTLAVLQKAGSLDEILKNPWTLPITSKQQTSLMKFKLQAEKMLRLVTLRTDVPAVWDALR